MILEFQKKMILSEDVLKFQGRLFCPLIIAFKELPLNIAGQAGAGGDDPAAELSQQLPVYTGLVIESFRKRTGDDSDQVFVAIVILCQQDEMPPPLILFGIPVKTASGRRIDFTADYRMNSRLPSLSLPCIRT